MRGSCMVLPSDRGISKHIVLVFCGPVSVRASFPRQSFTALRSGRDGEEEACLRVVYFLRHREGQEISLNPFNAEATFVQSTRVQRLLETICTLSCWYSLWYPYARVLVIFQLFCLILYRQN